MADDRGAAGRWWGAGRALPVRHAIDALYDHVADRLEPAGPRDPDLLPMSTGLLPLDRVLGGGIERGELTVVESDIKAQVDALLCTVARQVPHRCLIDGAVFLETTAWLVAGNSGVPEVGFRKAAFSAHEWDAVATGARDLARRDLLVSSCGSARVLAGATRDAGVEVVLVLDADRFGTPLAVIAALNDLARRGGVAVVAATGILPPDLPAGPTYDITRVSMHGFDLGGRATLVCPDAEDLLTVVHVEVDCLTGVVR